jgi:hypothetical protein
MIYERLLRERPKHNSRGRMLRSGVRMMRSGVRMGIFSLFVNSLGRPDDM